MSKKLLLATTILAVGLSSAANAADSVSSRIERLEQEIQLLKRQNEVKEEETAKVAEKEATVEVGKKGLSITSPDKKYQVAVKGVFQFDNRSFVNDESTNATNLKNETIVRRARPILTVKAGDALLYFMPDFAGTATTSNNTKIFDAYAEYKFSDAAKVRVGKFKPPVGLEQLQSDPDTFFMERGYAASLTPTRDVGAQLAGEVIPDILEYQLGIFNGTTDGGNADGDADDKKDFAGRVFAKPFRNSDLVSLQGFGAGIGGSIGDREGRTGATPTTINTYSSVGQQQFFSYTGAAYATGAQWRLQPQTYWFSGNKGVIAEYGISNINVSNATGAISRELQNTAWNVAASYVLTGEDINFSGGVKPAADFNPSKGTYGALELVARAGALEVDDEAFTSGLASLTASASKAETLGGGLNWYLSENLKIAANYNFTQFDRGAAAGADRADEHAIFSRIQFRF